MNGLRFALRSLTRSAGFTAVAMLTLALGIGACVAIFSVVNGVLLQPLPFPEPERLVVIQETQLPNVPETSVATGKYLEWSKQATSFESMGALAGMSYNLTGTGDPVHLYAARITSSLLSTLRLNPVLGRNFMAAEDLPRGQESVAILSHGLWQRRFAGRADVLSQTITLNGHPFTIVGVMPADSSLPDRVQVFTPMGFAEGEHRNFGYPTLHVVARLRSGVTLAEARGEMAVLAERTAHARPASRGWGVKVTPMKDSIVGNARPALLSLLGAVGFLLLIACANVANLLLTRASSRAKEMAVRSALGASRGKIVRQLLTESVLLAVLSGAFGVLIARAGLTALLALAPDALPRAGRIGIDGRALAFTLLLTVLTGIGFGLAPAYHAAQVNLNETLKQFGRGASEGGRRQRLRAALVVAEVAIAVVLLAGAGLLMRSFARLQEVNPGFNPRNAHVASIYLPRPKYTTSDQYVRFAQQTMAEMAALPEVQAVGVSANIPFGDLHLTAAPTTRFSIAGRAPASTADLPVATWYNVSPDYFRAMGIPLLRGRSFDARDVGSSRRVAIISQSLARRYFPGEDLLGKSIATTGPTPREIVGIVGDVRPTRLEAEMTPQMYEPFAQVPDNDMIFVVRTSRPGADGSLPAAIQGAIARVDPTVPVYNSRPLAALVGGSVARQRFAMTLFAIFSGLALLLAAIGIYGVTAYSIAQRTAEIGIRMALGAQTRDVLRLVLAQGGRLVAMGVLGGVLGALLLTRFLEKLVFAIGVHDPVTFVAIVVLLTAVAAVACLLPARRATRVSPMSVLRSQ
jgi:putative ABC transport system permease protein